MKLLKFFVAISLVVGSDHYQEKQIQRALEKNVKKATRDVGWELLFAAGETNQNKGKVLSSLYVDVGNESCRRQK